MKKVAIFIVLCLFIAIPAFTQVLNDYVSAVKGDTLVIKDYAEVGNKPSSLINAVELDLAAPAGRVYQLVSGKWYPMSRRLNSPVSRAIQIVGDAKTMLVQSKAADLPPMVTGYTDGTNTTSGGLIGFQSKVTIKNIILSPAVDNGAFGWACIDAIAPNNTLVMDNVLMEHTKWVMVESNDYAGSSLIFNNCYFVNLSGQACRRNGGVYDNVSNNSDSIMVENCTHIMAQGMLYKFRNYPITKVFFNHNTFVNCSGNVFESCGYQNVWSVTNNLFVNSNVQGYRPGLDYGETDQDRLPTGIINVRAFPSSTGLFAGLTEAGRKILVDANGLYWDPALDAMITTLNAGTGVNGFKTWVSQMITMNTRTQGLFNDNTTYPKLIEGAWIKGGNPNFVKPADLMTTQVTALIAWSVGTLDTTSTNVMPDWRQASNPAATNFIYPDWPIPVDLSYTNAAYLTAGYAKMPLGDLNWFPAKKTTWAAQAATEHAAIETALSNGTVLVTAVQNRNAKPSRFELNQNYPNPFNPTTNISFSVLESGNVTLKVYDAMGHEVATLVNGYRKAGDSYDVSFDASRLSSGTYVYTLSGDNFKVSKKMLLMK